MIIYWVSTKLLLIHLVIKVFIDKSDNFYCECLWPQSFWIIEMTRQQPIVYRLFICNWNRKNYSVYVALGPPSVVLPRAPEISGPGLSMACVAPTTTTSAPSMSLGGVRLNLLDALRFSSLLAWGRLGSVPRRRPGRLCVQFPIPSAIFVSFLDVPCPHDHLIPSRP